MITRSSAVTPSAAARILLVDDNKLGLGARKALLEEQGYEVTTAMEGIEALERFAETRYDIVITDYKMPRMNGLELIGHLRQLAPATPIVLISGYADALGWNEEHTGANAVIAKNANEVAHLIRAIRRLLQLPAKKPVRSQLSRRSKISQAK
ncbi:MAG TPA: response regulator [Bryobacteraceae bacterium]|nr:response regulator [Bryobacteraceae bacterium]